MYNNNLDKIDIYMKLNINTKTWITKFSLKQISFQGICMICQHKKYTYISLNTIESIYRFAWKANDSRGIHVYLKIWQNKHIHEMKTHTHKTNSRIGIQV